MKNLTKFFFAAVLSGIVIGIGGMVFLRVPNPLVGSWLFGIGLLSIVVLGFKLFTGVIGYLAIQGKNAPRYALECAVIWSGNFAGTYILAQIVRNTRSFPCVADRVGAMVADKLADGPLSIFLLAMLCGLLMYIAIDTFKKDAVPAPIRLVLLFLCVVVFILSGFEHCIANMFYISAAGAWNPHAFAWLGLMTIGNAAGGMLIPAVTPLYRSK